LESKANFTTYVQMRHELSNSQYFEIAFHKITITKSVNW